MASKLDNPIAELGKLLDGAALERLADALAEPDADFSAGELARIGAAFSQIGADFTAAAKETVSPLITGGIGKDSHYLDGGAAFKWRRGFTRTAVDSAAVKKLFPPADYPDLYKTSETRDTIAITL